MGANAKGLVDTASSFPSWVVDEENPATEYVEVWTFGYRRKKGIQTLIEWVRNSHTLVIDVRLHPNSVNPAWRKASFEGLLGEQYVWMGEWGNLNYNNRKPVAIANWEAGLERFRQMEGVNRDEPFGWDSVVLMCGCEELEGCHRRILSERLCAEGFRFMGEVPL